MNLHLSLATIPAWLCLVCSLPAFGQATSQDLLSRDAAGLVAVLENAESPAFEKAKACQRLAVVGTKESVPALAALLGDDALNVYARTALEGIPDAAADEALREAAGKLEGRPLIGVINSIGQRRDAEATPLLREFLSHEDPGVVTAAAASLGQVAPGEAVELLREKLASADDKAAIADACLICAERLSEGGQDDEAVALYQAVAAAELPDHVRADAIRGQILLQQADARDLLIEQLRSESERFFNLGLAMVREVPGAEVTKALVAELEKLPPERRALLLIALGDREERVPLDLLAAARRSESAAVRAAAIRVLAGRDDSEALRMLFDAALGDDETAQTARQSLKSHRSAELDQAVLDSLPEARGPARLVLLDLIAARRIADARPAVTSALTDADRGTRLAALAAFAQIAERDDLSRLVERAQKSENADEQTAARQALSTAAARMPDREATAAQLAGTMSGAPVDYQIFILELLGRLAGEKALAAVVASVDSNEPQIKDAATRVLGEWPNADAAAALLEVAQKDSENRYRIRALRGYLRIARQLQLPDNERLGMFHSAMKIATRDDERRLALDILTRIPSPETLELATASLSNAALRDAAADAAVKIAPRVIESNPKAVAEAMNKVVESGAGGDIGGRARQLLERARAAGG